MVVKIGSLQNGTIIESKKTSYWPETAVDKTVKKYELEEGDVLIAMTGATTGKLAIVPKKHSGSLLNQRVGRFLPNDTKKFYKLFGRYLFQTDNFQEKIGGNILKSAQGNISPTKIKNILIPIPGLSEQKSIAQKLYLLDQKTTEETDKKKALQKLFNTLLEYLMTAKIRV